LTDLGRWGRFRNVLTTCQGIPSSSSLSEPEVALTSHELALKAAQLADSKKAQDIVLMKLSEVTDFVDFFVVCTAQSQTQIHAVVEAILEGLEKHDLKVWSAEGRETRSWVLLDYVDVVVHVFLPDTRQFYALEKLWGDAPVEAFPA